MKLTLDSTEPLADVLRVINSTYGSALTTAGGRPPADTAARSAKLAARTRSAAADRRGKEAAVGDRVDPKLVRQWAWENGYELSPRFSACGGSRGIPGGQPEPTSTSGRA